MHISDYIDNNLSPELHSRFSRLLADCTFADFSLFAHRLELRGLLLCPAQPSTSLRIHKLRREITNLQRNASHAYNALDMFIHRHHLSPIKKTIDSRFNPKNKFHALLEFDNALTEVTGK